MAFDPYNIRSIELDYVSVLSILGGKRFTADQALADALGLDVTISYSAGVLGIIAPSASIVFQTKDGSAMLPSQIWPFYDTIELDGVVLGLDVISGMTTTVTDMTGETQDSLDGIPTVDPTHIYYVRQDGTATNKELANSSDSASTSMSMAVFNSSTFVPGDVIYFSSKGGDFTTGFTLRSSGVAGNPIIYSGERGFEPTIRANCNQNYISYILIRSLTITGSGSGYALIIYGVAGTVVYTYNLTINSISSSAGIRIQGDCKLVSYNTTAIVPNSMGINIRSSSDVTLVNGEFSGMYGIGINDTPKILIDGASIRSTNIYNTSIQLSATNYNLTIKNSRITEATNTTNRRLIFSTAGDVSIYNTVFNLNGGSVDNYLTFQSTMGNVSIHNSLFYNATRISSAVISNKSTVGNFKNNIFYYCNGNSYTDSAGVDNTCTYQSGTNSYGNVQIFDDPLFTDPATGDFTLTSNSPCIDTGADMSQYFTDDITGAQRVVPWDIGPYEYVAATPPEPTPPTIDEAEDNVGDVQGILHSGDTTDDTTPTFRGTSTAPEFSGIAIYFDDIYIGSTGVTSAGTWEFTPASPMTNGAHKITAVLNDTGNQQGLVSDPFYLTVQTAAPDYPPGWEADTYWGSGAPGEVNDGTGTAVEFQSNGDVDDPFLEGFNLSGMAVECCNNSVVVTITSDTYFKNWASGAISLASSPGDLFISNYGWNPTGTPPHYGEDRMSTSYPGTEFDAVVFLDNIWTSSASRGVAYVYATSTGEIGFGNPRQTQPSNFSPTGLPLGTGVWKILKDSNGVPNALQIIFLASDIASIRNPYPEGEWDAGFHWTNVSANDVVEREGVLEVPLNWEKDEYWGAGVTGQENTGEGTIANYATGGDVYDPFGGSEGFDLSGTAVEICNDKLVVTITSNTYFSNWVNQSFRSPIAEIAPGTLFISTTGWNPQGEAPHYGKDKMNTASTGTVWDVAVDLKGIIDSQSGAIDTAIRNGRAPVYRTVDGATYNTGIRTAQETYFDHTGATPVGVGEWEITDGCSVPALRIVVDFQTLVDAGWDKESDLAIHWANLAADDTVERRIPMAIPEGWEGDTFWGAGSNSITNDGTGSPTSEQDYATNGDLHDPTDTGYELTGSIITRSDDTLHISILAYDFFDNWLDGSIDPSAAPGDLFLCLTGWRPFGGAPYGGDNSTNGTVWDTVARLQDINIRGTESGDIFLYPIVLPDPRVSYGYPRVAQETYFTPAAGDTPTFGGTWSYDRDCTGHAFLKIELSEASLRILGWESRELGIHFANRTANDTIERGYILPPWELLDTSWGIEGDVQQDTSWGIENSNSADTSWGIKGSLGGSTSWGIENSEQGDTSWKILGEGFLFDTSWGILNTLNVDTEWGIEGRGDLETSWGIENSISQDTEWQIGEGNPVVFHTSWGIEDTSSTDTSWGIENSEQGGTSWSIENTNDIDTSWGIKDETSTDTSWGIQDKKRNDTSWGIDGEQTLVWSTSWKILHFRPKCIIFPTCNDREPMCGIGRIFRIK